MEGEEARNVVEGLIVSVTGLPLLVLVLALAAIRHRELAGWTLVALGVPLFELMLAPLSGAQARAGLAEWLIAFDRVGSTSTRRPVPCADRPRAEHRRVDVPLRLELPRRSRVSLLPGVTGGPG